MPLDKDSVQKALGQVRYPGFSRDIVSFGLLRGIEVTPEGKVTVGLAVTTADPKIPKQLYAEIEAVLKAAGAVDPEIASACTMLSVLGFQAARVPSARATSTTSHSGCFCTNSFALFNPIAISAVATPSASEEDGANTVALNKSVRAVHPVNGLSVCP